jgi:hypothetical protein
MRSSEMTCSCVIVTRLILKQRFKHSYFYCKNNSVFTTIRCLPLYVFVTALPDDGLIGRNMLRIFVKT